MKSCSTVKINLELAAFASATTYRLTFREEQLLMKQARFDGRHKLVPEIDLDGYWSMPSPTTRALTICAMHERFLPPPPLTASCSPIWIGTPPASRTLCC